MRLPRNLRCYRRWYVSAAFGFLILAPNAYANYHDRILRLQKALTIELAQQAALERDISLLEARLGQKPENNSSGSLWDVIRSVDDSWKELESKAIAIESKQMNTRLNGLHATNRQWEDSLVTLIETLNPNAFSNRLSTISAAISNHSKRIQKWSIRDKRSELCEYSTTLAEQYNWSFCTE